MVSHAIKIFSVSKKPDGKVVNTRIFYALGQSYLHPHVLFTSANT